MNKQFFPWELNPLVSDPQYLVCMAKISVLKEEGIIEKNFDERRAYESVDDRSHSYLKKQRKTKIGH